MLHIVTSSPFQSQALANCLQYLGENDEIILIQDAIYAGIEKNSWAEQIKNLTTNIYLLQEDIRARGVEDKLASCAKVIDYKGFVSLTVAHEQQMKWA